MFHHLLNTNYTIRAASVSAPGRRDANVTELEMHWMREDWTWRVKTSGCCCCRELLTAASWAWRRDMFCNKLQQVRGRDAAQLVGQVCGANLHRRFLLRNGQQFAFLIEAPQVKTK